MIVCVDCGDEMHTADNVQLHHFYITLCFSTLYSVQLHTGIVQNSCTKKNIKSCGGEIKSLLSTKKNLEKDSKYSETREYAMIYFTTMFIFCGEP